MCWPEQGKKGGGSKKARKSKELVRYPPVTGSREERCREALKHIAQVGRLLGTGSYSCVPFVLAIPTAGDFF